jgi:predicted DNA-binding protein
MMKKDIVKYTFNMSSSTKDELEQFSRDSGFMVCEIVRNAIDFYLDLPNMDLGFTIRKDTGK